MLEDTSHSAAQDRSDFWNRIHREHRFRDLHNTVADIITLTEEIVELADGLRRPPRQRINTEEIGEKVTDAAEVLARIARALDDRLDDEMSGT